MKKGFRIAILVLFILGITALCVLYLTSHNIVVMNPKGMIGMRQRELFITASLLMLIVVIPVFVLTLFFAWKYKESNRKSKYTPEWEHSYLAEFLWWGIPMVIIVILSVITWKSSHELNPFKPLDSDKKPLVIQVLALEWKWLFIYPEQGIATVNFFQFPEKTPINFEISADAPMNSFWIPQLGGQIYAMPAMRSKLHLIASEVGVFRGCSAHISGEGFSGMNFDAKSSSQEDFDRWVKSVKQSSNNLNLDEYNQLAKPSSYNPVTSYVLMQQDLFDRIVMKYHMPAQEKGM